MLRASENVSFLNLELVSDTLETFVITGPKHAYYVTSYRCPKLENLLFDGLVCGAVETRDVVLKALQEGVHSLDVVTMPADRQSDWFRTGFQEGVFSNSNFPRNTA
jgi:hypothetical protein